MKRGEGEVNDKKTWEGIEKDGRGEIKRGENENN